MKKGWIILPIIFSLIIVIVNCGCINNVVKKPTITMDSIEFEGINSKNN